MRSFLSQKIIIGCCLLLAVLVTTRIVFFAKFSDSLEGQIESNLRAAAQSRKALIELLIDQFRSEAEILARRQVVVQALHERMDTGNTGKSQVIGQALDQTVRAYGLHNAVVLDADLNVAGAYINEPARRYDTTTFGLVLTENASTFIGIHQTSNGKLVFGIASPIHENGIDTNRIIGLAYVEIDARLKLFPLVGTRSGETESAETLLLEWKNDAVTYLSPLRFEATAATLEGKREEYIDSAMPLNGEVKFLTGKDYRDVPVYGAAAAIAGTDWMVVSKIDQMEVRSPIILLRNVTVLGAVVVSILLVFVGRILWLSQREREAEAKSVIEENYNALVKASIDAYFALDSTGHIIDFNEAFLELTGSTDNSLLLKKLHAVNSAYASNLCDHLLVILRLNTTTQMQIPWQSQDGRLNNVLLSGIHVGGGALPLKEKFHFFVRRVGSQG